MGWGGAGTGALKGAGTGALVGSVAGPWGAGIGAGVGGLVGGIGGWFGEEDAEEREEELRRMLRPEAYKSFGSSAAGMALRQSLMQQIQSQYKQGMSSGLQTAGRSIASRGMLSSSVLPRAQGEVMGRMEREKGMGMARMGQTMAGVEANMMQQYRDKEFRKKLAMAGYLQRAGEAGQQDWGDWMSGMTEFGGTAAVLDKYLG